MPKQPKKGLNYFTLDCDIFSKSDELRPLLRRFKADGLAVYIHILCDVYANGYYFQPTEYEDYLFDLAEDCGLSVEKVQLILAFMADRTLLDAFSLNKNTVFTSHGIQKRYAEAMKGRKKSVAEIKGEHWLLSEKDESELDTFYKCTHSADKSEKMTDKSEKIGDKSEIYSTTEQNRTYISPLTPQGGGERDIWEEKFFGEYPKLKALSKYSDIDYKALYRRFGESKDLRGKYSAKWVFENYSDILAGTWKDEDTLREEARRRSDWYAAIREAAENVAEKNLKRARENSEFKQNESAISDCEIQLAKAEVFGGDVKGIGGRLQRLKSAREELLREMNMSEEMFVVKRRCARCNDTGTLPGGALCDCYKNKEAVQDD